MSNHLGAQGTFKHVTSLPPRPVGRTYVSTAGEPRLAAYLVTQVHTYIQTYVYCRQC